jgi:hypothetical protein
MTRPALLIPLLALASSFTAPALAAQDFERPEDWQVRFDEPGASEDQLEMFVSMPPGWHVTSGPAAIYWDPEMEASGEYRIEMEVFLFEPHGMMREAFGFFTGGLGLDGADIEYTYFLIRDGGEFIVKRREGADAPTVLPWTGHEAILGWADRGDGTTAKNILAAEADADEVRFFVNDAQVAVLPRTEVAMDGIYGFRVNHMLNLHISRLEVTPLD